MFPPRSNLASANDQGLPKFKNQGNYRFILSSASFKGHSPDSSHIASYSRSYKMLDPP